MSLFWSFLDLFPLMSVFNIRAAVYSLSLILKISAKDICVSIVSVESGEAEDYNVPEKKEKELCVYHSVMRNFTNLVTVTQKHLPPFKFIFLNVCKISFMASEVH